jgi:MFS family permease
MLLDDKEALLERPLNSVDDVEPRLLGRRWLMLFLFSICNGFPSIIQMSFSGVQAIALEYWPAESKFVIQTLVTSYMFAAIPMTFAGVFLLERAGLRASLNLSCLLFTVGCWMRYACRAPHLFWGLWTGQLLVGISQAFVNIAPTMLAKNWFGDKERSLATSIATLGGIVGQGIGFAASGAIVTGPSKIPTLVLYEAILGSVIAAVTVAFFRGEPPVPPSEVAAEHFAGEHDFGGNLRKLFLNPFFYAPCLAFGVIFGGLASISTLINQIVAPVLPASETAQASALASYLGATAIGSGCLGAVSIGVVIDITRKYKAISGSVSFLLTGCVAWLALSLYLGASVPALYACVASVGFLALAVIPALYEIAVEATFPVPEANSTGILTLVGQVLGFSFVPLLDALQKPDGDMRVGVWVICALFGCASAGLIFSPQRYYRLHEERRLKASHHHADQH